MVYGAVALNVTGGTAPYSWSVSSGALPGGLTLSGDGQVAGTPTKAGHFTFVATVADSGGGKDNLTGSISIVAALTVNFLKACGSAGKCSVEQGCVSVCGGFAYQGGGTTPYSYSLTSGSVPPGTYQYGLSLAGTFTTTGTYTFKATVTDGYGATASVSPTFKVFQHISLASGTCYGDYNTGCTANLLISGGSGSPKAKLVSEAANNTPNPPPYAGQCWTPSAYLPNPPGSYVSAAGTYATVFIPNRQINGYGGVWTVTVSDHSLCSAGTYCTSPAATVVIGVQCG